MISTVIKVIAWILVILPVAAFLFAGIKIIGGLMADDGFIKMLVSTGFAIFMLGAIVLILIYLTDVLQFIV